MLPRKCLRSILFAISYASLIGCEPTTSSPNTNTGGSAGSGGDGNAATSSSSSTSTSSSSTGSGGQGGNGGEGGGAINPECTVDNDCVGHSGGTVCDVANGTCVACVLDTQCALGSICTNHACAPGCSTVQACTDGLSCCDGVCHDLLTENENCGACNEACTSTVNSDWACLAGTCTLTSCQPNFYDCNLNPNDGCEQIDIINPCTCIPGTVESCYTGEAGTLGIGPCLAGTRTCAASGTEWSSCQGQVLPKWEICDNQIDEDCNGLIDDGLDRDGDGWTMCNGDCFDFDIGSPWPGSAKLVNPGALEIVGNGMDDDCDPSTSDTMPAPDCSTAEKLSDLTPMDLVQAMDLCQSTTENAPLPVRKWGVIDAQFLLADGSLPSASDMDAIINQQTAVLAHYGDMLVPYKGATMAGLSTGLMRDTVHHGYTGSTSFSSVVGPPAKYIAKTGGELPHPGGCAAATTAHDSVNLRVRLRVPTNANRLEYLFGFASAENAQEPCVPRDDFALGLIDPIPSTWSWGSPGDLLAGWTGLPSSVNSAFFGICSPWAPNTCPAGASLLTGTPMQRMTNFNSTIASMDAGQTITLDFLVFDGDDATTDSVLLLDGFVFSYSTTSCLAGSEDSLLCHP